jgi:hypothetical protein
MTVEDSGDVVIVTSGVAYNYIKEVVAVEDQGRGREAGDVCPGPGRLRNLLNPSWWVEGATP